MTYTTRVTYSMIEVYLMQNKLHFYLDSRARSLLFPRKRRGLVFSSCLSVMTLFEKVTINLTDCVLVTLDFRDFPVIFPYSGLWGRVGDG